jgi:hypothetical protein
MMGETKSRRPPNNLPTRPAGVRCSDHRPSAFQRRREGISGVLLAEAFGHSVTGHDSSGKSGCADGPRCLWFVYYAEIVELPDFLTKVIDSPTHALANSLHLSCWATFPIEQAGWASGNSPE